MLQIMEYEVSEEANIGHEHECNIGLAEWLVYYFTTLLCCYLYVSESFPKKWCMYIGVDAYELLSSTCVPILGICIEWLFTVL